MRHLVTAALVAAASPAFVIENCLPVVYDMPSCWAGSWFGSNDIGAKIYEMLNRFAPTDASRNVTVYNPDILIAMQIYPDGFYVTVPFGSHVTVDDVMNRTGDLITTDLNLQVHTQLGYMWAQGNSLYFCGTDASFGPTLQMEASGPDGSRSTTIMPGPGTGGFEPDIQWTCSGDTFTMSVNLPEPVGRIDHTFTRVPDGRFAGDLADYFDAIESAETTPLPDEAPAE